MNAKSWKVLLVAALAVAGCGRMATDAEEAQDAVDTTESTSNESALMDITAVESPMCSSTSDAIAEAASLRTRTAVKDAACVVATRTGNKVTYVMTNCTGKWGRVTVTGTVDVTYTRNADCSVDAVATGRGIKVNKATIDLDATAHYVKDAAGLETLTVSTHSKGGTESVQLDHSGSYVVTRDQASQCRTLDGNWSTDWNASRGSAMTSTEASGLKKCGDACPVAGGKIVHQGLLGRVVTVSFDGSAVAQWSSNKGKSGTINLDCGQ